MLILGSFILILDSYRAAGHNLLNSEVYTSSENCDLHPLSSLYFLHSLKTVCVDYSPHLSLMRASALRCTHNPFTDTTSTQLGH